MQGFISYFEGFKNITLPSYAFQLDKILKKYIPPQRYQYVQPLTKKNGVYVNKKFFTKKWVRKQTLTD